MTDDRVTVSLPMGLDLEIKTRLGRPADLGRYVADLTDRDQIDVLFGWSEAADDTGVMGVMGRLMQMQYMRERLDEQPDLVRDAVQRWVNDMHAYLCGGNNESPGGA